MSLHARSGAVYQRNKFAMARSNAEMVQMRDKIAVGNILNFRNFPFGKLIRKISACKQDEFSCSDGTCVPIKQWCDGKNDCSDNGDEQIGCKKGNKTET